MASVEVSVGTCRCPGSPHPDGDTVWLAEKMPLPMGFAALHVVRTSQDPAELEGRLALIYLRFGITAWSFTDEDSQPVRLDPDRASELIEQWLPLWEGGMTVARRADELYGEAIFYPFTLARDQMRKSSPPGPTVDSTSANPDSGTAPQTPSAPSSRSGTAGKRSAGRAP
jgi:hypothetical protein